ncbi:MAG: HD domain-containing protein [Puniceicoccaceae bacterium]|nr:MAG: HD domain-containing protein [Puniceicoccaceae bacterium]
MTQSGIVTDYSTIKALNSLDCSDSQADTIHFTGVYFIKRKLSKIAKNGNPYLMIDFTDASGNFTSTVFNNNSAYTSLNDLSEGSLIKMHGSLRYYNEKLSPEIQSIARYSMEEATNEGIADQLIEVPPESEVELWATLCEGIERIKHPALKATVQSVIDQHETAFRTSPAAISMHHAYRHGLLEHSVHMLRVGIALLPIYPEVDPDLALAGILLHDIGKLEEYEGEFSAQTSRLGLLQGHVVLGYKIVRKAAILSKLNLDLCERLEHIILSHQGEKEWGAAAMAATPEAVFVSMVDNLDAKMGMVQRALRNAPEGAIYSDYLAGLKTKVLLMPPEKED